MFAAMPTKGLVASKNKQEDKCTAGTNGASVSQLEGSSVDLPHHKEISKLASELTDNKELPAGIKIPSTLPQTMRERAPNLHQDDFDAFFNVQENRQSLDNGQLSSTHLVSLYMLSFRNILEYDLDSMQDLRDRYIRYFANILADILEMCYPQSLPARYVSAMHC